MSDDLVKRLREYGDWPQDVLYREWAEWSHKAADRIEQLEAALRKYADEEYNGYNADGAHARKALEGKDD